MLLLRLPHPPTPSPHPLLDHSALRGLDEADEFVNLRDASELFADAFEGLRGVELGGEEEAEGLVERVDCRLRVLAPLHADVVETVAAGVVADREGEGERV